MRTLIKVGILIIFILAGFIILNWDKLWLSYHGMQMLKPEKRLDYFQDGQEYAQTRLIAKSSNPKHLKVSESLLALPDSFRTTDSLINTASYIENARYEGLLVLKNAEIVYENYWNGFNEHKTHVVNSITKSIISIAVGIAIDEGLIASKDDLIVKYLPQFKDSWYREVSIDDCLDMVSGVKWEHDIPMMLEFSFKWGWNITTAEKHLLNLEAWHEPGEQMVYNSMDPLMLGLVLKQVIGERTISEYIHEKLWDPIGAENHAFFNYLDENSIETTWAGIYATMRDLAKVGQLYLQRGKWNGKQLVSESWVDQSFSPHRKSTSPRVDVSLGWEYDTHGWGYNNFWWIPDDTNGNEIFAFGLGGQCIYINRQTEVVVVSFRANPLDLTHVNPDFLDRSMLDFMQAISTHVEN